MESGSYHRMHHNTLNIKRIGHYAVILVEYYLHGDKDPIYKKVQVVDSRKKDGTQTSDTEFKCWFDTLNPDQTINRSISHTMEGTAMGWMSGIARAEMEMTEYRKQLAGENMGEGEKKVKIYTNDELDEQVDKLGLRLSPHSMSGS